MSASTQVRHCVSCKGTNLANGSVARNGHAFKPAGAWLGGLGGDAVACLDCGFVGEYLDPPSRAKLAERVKLRRAEGKAT